MTAHNSRIRIGAIKTCSLIMAALLCLALTAGCGARQAPGTAADEPAAEIYPAQPTDEAAVISTAGPVAPDTAESGAAESGAAEPAAAEPAAAEPAAAATDENAAPGSPEIIAESANTVSDKEKQQILDELTGELDKAIVSLGELEEPDAWDTDAGSIE